MDEECVHGLGDPAWCTICNGRENRQGSLEKTIQYTFKAKFNSKCNWCGESIEVGDFIVRTALDDYICEECHASL